MTEAVQTAPETPQAPPPAPEAPEAAPALTDPFERAMAALDAHEAEGSAKAPAEAAPETPEAPDAPVEAAEEEAPKVPTHRDWSELQRQAERVRAMEREARAAKESAARELAEAKREAETLRGQAGAWVEAAKLAKAGDKLGALKALGITYAELTQAVLTGGQAPDLSPVQSQIDELKTKLQQEREDAQKQAAAQEAERHQRAYRSEAKALLEEKGEDGTLTYELLATVSADPVAEIYAYAEGHWQRTGKVLQPHEAAKALEDYLEKQHLQRLTGSAKLRRALGASASPDQPQTTTAHSERARTEVTPKGVPPSSTLTNADASAASRISPEDQSEAARIARAIRAAEQLGT